MDKIQPTLDFLVIQMDGDVSRKEKVSHCGCGSVKCPLQNIRNPLECDIKPEYRNNCPVLLPCPKHNAPVSRLYGTPEVFDPFMVKRNRPYLHCYPLRRTEAWIAAAYDNLPEIEFMETPGKMSSLRRRYIMVYEFPEKTNEPGFLNSLPSCL